MRISPINATYSYLNLNKFQKSRKVNFDMSICKDTFEKSTIDSASNMEQSLSFGKIDNDSFFGRRRVKKAIGERYFKPLDESLVFELEYQKNFPGLVYVARFKKENLSDDPNAKKEISKIQKTFIENHSDRFTMKNFETTGFTCHGTEDLIMISTLAKKFKPYEIDRFFGGDDSGGHSDGYDEIFEHDSYFT